MNELTRVTISIPKRGVRVIPPESIAARVEYAKHKAALPIIERRRLSPVVWSLRDLAQLDLILYTSILNRRYPSPEVGKAFMKLVDYDYRDKLVQDAKIVTNTIVKSVKEIDPHKQFGVILFGSVARGLVKSPGHEDPSNIDMAVIGGFSESERNILFDKIRPIRYEIQHKLLKLNHREQSDRSCNVGVHIQTLNKLTRNSYSTAMEYISSCAYPLFDSYQIWKQIENKALESRFSRILRSKKSL